jgi:hypothetical protein
MEDETVKPFTVPSAVATFLLQAFLELVRRDLLNRDIDRRAILTDV